MVAAHSSYNMSVIIFNSNKVSVAARNSNNSNSYSPFRLFQSNGHERVVPLPSSTTDYSELSTYNSDLELFNEFFVLLNVGLVLVGRDEGHSDGDRSVGLLQRDVDLLLELLHVQADLVAVLHQREVDVANHRLEALESLLRLVFLFYHI